MKVIKSLENRGILIKVTIRNITSQKGGFLSFIRLLIAASLPLMKSKLNPLAKNVLIPLGLSAGMSAAGAAIQKKIYGSSHTSLKMSNWEMEDIMEIVKPLEEPGLLIKGISETIKYETKKEDFFSLLEVINNISWLTGNGVTRAGEGVIRAGQNI